MQFTPDLLGRKNEQYVGEKKNPSHYHRTNKAYKSETGRRGRRLLKTTESEGGRATHDGEWRAMKEQQHATENYGTRS